MPFVPTSGSQGAVTVAKSMFRRKSVSDIIYSDVIISSKAKGKWHMIHFLCNDYYDSRHCYPLWKQVYEYKLGDIMLRLYSEYDQPRSSIRPFELSDDERQTIRI
eukprot:g26115.t1